MNGTKYFQKPLKTTDFCKNGHCLQI